MRGLERELVAAKQDQQITVKHGDADPGKRSSSAPPQATTRFTSFKYSKIVPGAKLYKPPHTTQEPLYTDEVAVFGARGISRGGAGWGTSGAPWVRRGRQVPSQASVWPPGP